MLIVRSRVPGRDDGEVGKLKMLMSCMSGSVYGDFHKSEEVLMVISRMSRSGDDD